MRVIQEFGKEVEAVVENLEPEQVETAVRVIVRIVLTYQVFIHRFVENFVEAIITTIKEYQWEPLSN